MLSGQVAGVGALSGSGSDADRLLRPSCHAREAASGRLGVTGVSNVRRRIGGVRVLLDSPRELPQATWFAAVGPMPCEGNRLL